MSLLHLAGVYLRTRALLPLSALAIALGVGVLFCVLSVINGFLAEFERTLREFAGDVVVRPLPAAAEIERPLPAYQDALRGVAGLAGHEARLNWFGLVGRRGARALTDPRSSDLNGLLLVGVDPEHLPHGTGENGADALLLGDALAERLEVAPGDVLEVLTFYTGARGLPVPARHSFRVAGTFDTGSYEQDLDRALVVRSTLAALVHHSTGFSEIVLRAAAKVAPEALAERAAQALEAAGLAAPAWRGVSTWREQGGNFLRAVENQKGILSTVFFFIVLVAAYQLVATLTLTVTEKRRDIGVMSALGASPARLAAFFVALGLLIALCGTALGLLLGWWMCGHLELVESWIGRGQPIFTAEIYQFDRIPVAVDPLSVALLAGATLAVALIFSFWPAWRATRVPVVKVLAGR